MRRREFLGMLLALTAMPVLTRAEDAARPVIGFLHNGTAAATAEYVVAFRRGLGEVGFTEGQNVAIEYRWAEGRNDLIPELVSDLAARYAKVIVAVGGSVPAVAARHVTTVPLVFLTGGDPVQLGLAASLNRPGGNATGIATLTTELVNKRLEVLRDLVPAAKSIAILVNPNGVIADADVRATRSAAGPQMQVTVLKASTPSEIDLVFASLTQRPVDALLLGGDAFFNSRRDQLVALAARHRIPAVFDTRSYAEAGGLVSYGPDYAAAYRECGAYVGRILRGARPGDLPVVQLSKIELVINLKTARTLGLELPGSLLARADEVIE
jgi:putative tryptophan/tyrosine transport system substrate-binding protein